MSQEQPVMRHLYQVPELRTEIAELIYREFWVDDPGASTEWTFGRLGEAREPCGLPLCLVTVEQGRAVGVVNVIEYDDPNPRVGRPWLAGTVIVPERRRQGIWGRVGARGVR